MRPISLEEFARLCGGELRADGAELIRGFATDSREVAPGDLFVAIRGARVDGHDFASEARERGAVAVLAERDLPGPIIRVPNVIEALARFASARREGHRGPVIGITGSNGKTATKEFTAAALSPRYRVLKSPGNRNTEITSPLLWASWEPEVEVVVTELAMRGRGQIAHLCRFTRPTHGIVTMIGTAHIETVGSREGIAEAKAELLDALPADGVALLWAEDDFFGTLKARSPKNCLSFGFSESADARITGYRALDWQRCLVRGRIGGRAFEITLATIGRHQALNATAALLMATCLGVPLEEAVRGVEGARMPPQRMERRERGGAVVLLDTYNASPDSTVAALRTLGELPATGRKLVVLGDMRELGPFSELGHRRVGAAVAEVMPDAVCLFGHEVEWVRDEAIRRGLPEGRFAPLARSLSEVRSFLAGVRPGDVVLVKASRALGLERALEEGDGEGAW